MSYADCLGCTTAGTTPVEQVPALIVYHPQTVITDTPSIIGPRMGARFIAQRVWLDGAAFVRSDFDLTRAEVAAACWWAGLYGTKVWRKRYGAWAQEARLHMWYGCGGFPDPPMGGAA